VIIAIVVVIIIIVSKRSTIIIQLWRRRGRCANKYIMYAREEERKNRRVTLADASYFRRTFQAGRRDVIIARARFMLKDTR